MRIFGAGLVIACLSALVVHAQESSHTLSVGPGRITVAELDSLPTGIEVVHAPDPVAAARVEGKPPRYQWTFTTTLRSSAGPVKIEEFGCLVWARDGWRLGNFTRKPFDSSQFAEWYQCPNAELIAGVAYCDSSNWTYSSQLTGMRTKWYYVGVESDGSRVKGEAEIQCLPKLLD